MENLTPFEQQTGAALNKVAHNESALAQFTLNLNQQAISGKLDKAVCRENEIQQIIQILARRHQNNAILVGEPGVGKTAIAEGLAVRIHKGEVPKLLQHTQIHMLDLELLQADTNIKEELTKRLQNLITAIKAAAQPIILFIDAAHTFMKADAQNNQNDVINLLRPALIKGELHCITATTWPVYKQYFKNDPLLARHFQLIKVKELEPEAACHILRHLAPSLEQHHSVFILDDALTHAVQFSMRYINDRYLPDKAITVLDTACAQVAAQQHTVPAQIKAEKQQLAQLALEKVQLLKESRQGIPHKARLKRLDKNITVLKKNITILLTLWEQQKHLAKQLTEISQQLHYTEVSVQKELQVELSKIQRSLAKLQRKHAFIHPYVDSQVIASVIADRTGIPISNILKTQAQQILALEEQFKAKIIGQDHAIQQIVATLKTVGTQLMDPHKPLGVYLFVGPSGTGKTATALVLAETLFGSREKMITLNMSEFNQAHTVTLLTGSPPGIIGGKDGLLTEAVRRNPYSIILLNEMEKAHPSVQDIFYQVFDKGILQDSQGHVIDFKNTLIIMTANVASQTIVDCWQKWNNMNNYIAFNRCIQTELHKSFKSAFLERIQTVPYLPLSEQSILAIVKLKLRKLKQRLASQHHIGLDLTTTAMQAIVTQCHNTLMGAHQIDTLFNRFLLPEITHLILQQIIKRTVFKKIEIDYSNRKWKSRPIYAPQRTKIAA